MNSFIFLPRLLSIEPSSGIIADRDHRERERESGIHVYSFELAACFKSLNDWPAMVARLKIGAK